MMGIAWMPGRGHAGDRHRVDAGRGHADDRHRVDAGSRSRRRWGCRRSRSEGPGGLIGALEGAQAGKENGAMVVEGDEEFVAEVGVPLATGQDPTIVKRSRR